MAEVRARFTLSAKDKTGKAFSTVGRGLKGLGTLARKVARGIGLAVGALGVMGLGAVVGVIGLMNKFAESSDNAGKKARRFGFAASEGLGLLRFAAEDAGVAAATMDMVIQRAGRRIGQVAEAVDTSKMERKLAGMANAFNKLSPRSSKREPLADRMRDLREQIDKANEGAGEAKFALDALGLSGKALSKMDPMQKFLTIMQKIDKIGSKDRQAFLVMKLFDTEGVAALQLLEGGYSGLLATIERGRRLGAGVSDKQSLAAAGYNDALHELSTSGKAFIREVITPLYPIATAVLKPMTDALVRMRVDGFDALFNKALDYLPATLELWRSFSKAVKGLEPVARATGSAISGMFGYFASDGFAGLLTGLGWIHDKLSAIARLSGRGIGGSLATGKALSEGNVGQAGSIAVQTAMGMREAYRDIVGATGDDSTTILGMIYELLRDQNDSTFARAAP